MSDTALATTNHEGIGAIERVIALGDLSKLTPEQRSRYFLEVCASLKLNPLTRPFEYLTLSGKLVLYARKDATDQLRKLHRISLEITARETVGDLYVVTAKAFTPDGRTDEEIGAVSIKGLSGDALANALMKCSTKAKRRVTLSVCGLGMLDETELETVRDAFPVEPTTYGSRRVEEDETPRAALPADRYDAELIRPPALPGDLHGGPPLRVPASMDPARTAAPMDRNLTGRESNARVMAQNILARMKALKPSTTVTLPEDDDPVNVWTSFVDTYGPLVDEAEAKRRAR